MADLDTRGNAWRVPPSAYLARRPAEYKVPTPFSLYLTMADGCRIAVDVYLPGGDRTRRWPTVCIFTPYYRRFAVEPGATGVEACPNAFRYRDMFVPRGYAMVVVDVRGTGASFGTRDSFRSPRERDDYRAIADWIIHQSWSDGTLGATGISYLGAACDFLASTGHPAVRAIAPLFAVWDTYVDNYYPGGLLIKRLAKVYDEMMVALDHDQRPQLREFAYFRNPALAGPMPVDEDADGSILRTAVREHLANFRMPDFMADFKFRDDRLPYDPSFGTASFSPYNYCEGVPRDVAVYAISGWMDGAGYANGAIGRFLTLPNPNRRLLLGPWDHGARINASPWRARPEPEFSVFGEVLRFFDHHICGHDTGLDREQPIHFFSVHAEEWRASDRWPVARETRRLHCGPAHQLAATEPASVGTDVHQSDFSMGTGAETRYERIAGIEVTRYYSDWQGRDERMLSYDSEPLPADLEIAGHPVVSLWLASSEPDAAVFAYLSEVESDGAVRYVTEGQLRAIHRAEAPCPDKYRTAWPWHPLSREAARPMPIGKPQRIRLALLPIAWRFAKGSRIRLSLAGSDADHFAQTPHGRPPRLTLHWGNDAASALELPAL